MLLSDLYMQDKDSLIKSLQNSLTPQGAIRIIHTYLVKITDLEGRYVSGLTRPQARIALSILGIHQEHYRLILNTFESLNKSTATHPAPTPPPQMLSGYIGPLSNDALAGISAATLVAAVMTNPFLAIPLGAGAGLVAAKLLHNIETLVPAAADIVDSGSNTVLYGPISNFEYIVFLSDLEQLFKNVDDVVGEFNKLEDAARPRPVIPKLEDHTRFLEFIQDLLGWYQRRKGELPEAAARALESRLEEQLPDLFSEYNIQVHYYNPNSDERNFSFFDFESEIGDSGLGVPLMTRPALSKKGEIFLRGRVIDPRPSTTIDIMKADPQ